MAIKLLKKQLELMQSTSKVILFVAGVGSGKSHVASWKAVCAMLEGRHILLFAQSYKSLKLVLFEEILQRLRELGIDFILNKADMTIQLPATGGRVFGFSSDSIEACRGITADMCIMDEASLYDLYVYQVAQTRLRRPGFQMQTIIITTPRGTDSWVYKMSLRADIHFIHQKTLDNIFLPDGYVEQLLLDFDGNEALMRQELEASFEDFGDSNAIISPIDLRAARKRTPYGATDDELRICGFDVAREGGDRCALMLRHGSIIPAYEIWQGTKTQDTAKRAVEFCIKYNVDVIVVDAAGMGVGVYDLLTESLKGICDVVDYNGVYQPTKKQNKYANARAESWFEMRNWIASEGSLPDDEQFNEMTAITYHVNNGNKILVDSKIELKKNGISSPDVGDSLSLTFSRKVRKKVKQVKQSSKPRRFIGI